MRIYEIQKIWGMYDFYVNASKQVNSMEKIKNKQFIAKKWMLFHQQQLNYFPGSASIFIFQSIKLIKKTKSKQINSMEKQK